jgi:hypothetical protein
MAEPTQLLMYDHEELAALMLKDQGITSGLWRLTLGMNLTAGNFGVPGTEGVHPGNVAVVTKIGIQKVDAPGPLVVDAGALDKRRDVAVPAKKNASAKKGGRKPAG